MSTNMWLALIAMQLTMIIINKIIDKKGDKK